jgi:hypothetical protein
MGKPVVQVAIETFDGRKGRVRALFDTGAHRTLIREDCLPEGCVVERRPTPERLRTAAQGGTLDVVGGIILLIGIGDRLIQTDALVSPNLAQQMLIGAATMQAWDITVRNENGTTRVEVGHDLRDPDIQEVD